MAHECTFRETDGAQFKFGFALPPFWRTRSASGLHQRCRGLGEMQLDAGGFSRRSLIVSGASVRGVAEITRVNRWLG